MSTRIPGRPGTQKQADAAGISTGSPMDAPPATQERQVPMQRDQQGPFVQFGTLRIRVDPASLGGVVQRAGDPLPPAFEVPAAFRPILHVLSEEKDQLLARPGVLSVRAGYRFDDGRITQSPAIVVSVDDMDVELPTQLKGVFVDKTPADPVEQMRRAAEVSSPSAFGAATTLIEALMDPTGAVEELSPNISYKPPAHADLAPVTAPMTVTCSVSPDNGWAVLKPFLLGTSEKMRLGMYDFTAPHIYKAVRAVLKDSDVSWRQTLDAGEALPGSEDIDSTKASDIPEARIIQGLRRAAGTRFGSAFARTGAGQTFSSAYHIKVAVRDDAAFWLSSGNWQSSNQPDIDLSAAEADRREIARYNREWHMLVESPELALKFQRFLEHDFDTAAGLQPAREAMAQMPDLFVPIDEFYATEAASKELDYFPALRRQFPKSRPLEITPILSPDNYVPVVLGMLRERPHSKLYFQNQSLNPISRPTEEFAELLRLLAKYSQDPALDVRIIFRNIGPVRKKLESLQLAGFNMDRVKMQAGCHTKGIVIDGETLLVGSHNWTNQGTQFNRDASLLLKDSTIARYFERIFLHDWEKLSTHTVRPESTPIIASGAEATGLESSGRYVRVPWSFYEED